jgi:nucleoside-diphosphate-sugar epimerase
MNEISVFGSSGFVGSRFCEMYDGKCLKIDRESDAPLSDNILYLISTIDNYNVFDNPYLDIETNLTKLVSVLEEVKTRRSPVFNFVSSWFVYGKTDNLPVREIDPCNPSGFYSITKYAAERMVESYCQTFGIKYRIMRLSNIIGPNDKKVSKKRGALQYMFNQLKTGETVNLYDEGEPIRDYMHVDDCCRAISLTINRRESLNGIVNISNSNPKKIGDLVNYAKDYLKSNSKVVHMPTPDFHGVVQSKNMYLDNTKLRTMGYVPSMSVYDAIKDVLDEDNH